MITPIHQWTHTENKVLLLRFVDNNYQSYGGFQWPRTVGAKVVAPDWDTQPQCGGGLHGWPWGIGLGDGKEPNYRNGVWQVIAAAPADVVSLGGKAKVRSAIVTYIGSWWGAMERIREGRDAWILHAARGAASATGESGAASATGESGAASATGERGAASATGWNGAASATGESSAAATTEEYSTVEVGRYGVAVSTADKVTWIARRGAIFVHRWKGGVRAYSFKSIKAADGEKITFLRGQIIERVKP